MRYDWILFDADETLFSFDAFAGLTKMFQRCGVDFSRQDYLDYEQVNLPLWVDYQNGHITAAELKHKRFQAWAEKLNTTTDILNCGFLEAMAEVCTLLPGVRELLEFVHGKAKLGIITNGFKDLQDIRLEKNGLTGYFDHIVISELVGVAKPAQEIFSYAYEKMDYPSKSRVLMVGDNLKSDILGGNNFGIDTCWLQHDNSHTERHISPTFTIRCMSELKTIVAG
ncbi:pyrimidine 5'-nucleotidase [Vibrio caribbeanicus]|uniref:pyrimidine 5'-nucleotidase n=1 Tax=Vibrio caribbeanicus TaxID=701175 RepID=UPI0030D76C8A